MKKIYFLLILGITLISNQSFSQAFEWAKLLGDTSVTYSQRNTLAIDDQSYLYTTSRYSGTFEEGNFSLSNGQNFIAKYDTIGNIIWAINFPVQYINDIEVSGSDLYIVGELFYTFDNGDTIVLPSTEDAFIAKLDTSGDFKWIKLIVDSTNQCNAKLHGIVVNDSLLFATGTYLGDSLAFPDTALTWFAYSWGETFTMCTDLDGNYKWARNGGGYEVKTRGNVLASCGYSDVDPSSSGTIYCFDFYGNQLWMDVIGAAYPDDYFYDVAFDNVGYIYIVGKYGMSAFIIKYSPSGDIIWANILTDYLCSSNNIIYSEQENALYISGNIGPDSTYFGDPLSPNLYIYSLFIAKLDTACNIEWQKICGGPLPYPNVCSITMDNNNNIYLTGNIGEAIGTTMFDTIPIINYSNYVPYMAKINPDLFVGNEEIQLSFTTSLNIYPNPTTGLITIKNEKSIIKNVSVFDIYGKEVLMQDVTLRDSKCELNLSQQPKGIYIIKVQTERGVAVEKVILN